MLDDARIATLGRGELLMTLVSRFGPTELPGAATVTFLKLHTLLALILYRRCRQLQGIHWQHLGGLRVPIPSTR